MWLLLAFLTAFLTSLQDIVAKIISGKVSPYVTAWAWTFFSVPVLALAFIGQRPVVLGPDFWPAIMGSTLILTVSSVLMYKSIGAADLSQSVPLLSFTPLFLLVTSPVMVGELPHPSGIAGVILIVAGSYFLFSDPAEGGFLAPFQALLRARGSRYMLIVAFLFSIGGNIDKIGTRNSSPVVWSLVLNCVVSVVLGAVMLLKVPDAMRQLKEQRRAFFMLGIFLGLMMIAQMTAIMMTQVPYLIAVKRTSIVMSSLWGFWIFKEQAAGRRLWGVLLMVAGVFVISFVG